MGVVGMNVRGMILQQRFQAEANELVTTLRFAQDLMVFGRVDVSVVFKAEKDRLTYTLQPEEKLPEQWEKVIKQLKGEMTAVHSIHFGDDKEEDELVLNFKSGGTMMSKGVLYLSSREEFNPDTSEIISIVLKGYPSPIRLYYSFVEEE